MQAHVYIYIYVCVYRDATHARAAVIHIHDNIYRISTCALYIRFPRICISIETISAGAREETSEYVR